MKSHITCTLLHGDETAMNKGLKKYEMKGEFDDYKEM